MADDAARVPKRLIPLAQVRAMVALSKTTIYDRIKAGSFPRPVLLGSSSRWVESEIDAWIEEQVARRDGCGGGASVDADGSSN